MDLADIFSEQIKLNERIAPTLYGDIADPEIRKKWFLNFELALRQESAEAVDSLSWKWWKKADDDWDNIKVELVDMLHFWVSMCTVAGLTAEDVVQLYFKKNALNHRRQELGYKDGTYNKYEGGVEDNQRFVLNADKDQ
jgi:dimeric dUTPase (all-alpha-NTP-PPase superfamily)